MNADVTEGTVPCTVRVRPGVCQAVSAISQSPIHAAVHPFLQDTAVDRVSWGTLPWARTRDRNPRPKLSSAILRKTPQNL